MRGMLARIFRSRAAEPAPSKGDVAYEAAMNESDELLKQMRNASSSSDAARAVMADVWAQNHNVPFLTTVYETVQEMKSGTDQKPDKK